jgi:hypothetical protein
MALHGQLNPSKISIMILLFDLAGVLLDFCGIESTWQISEGAVSPAEFGRFWSKSPVADRLYRGQITPEQPPW